MSELTLIIPAKEEKESLPLFLNELKSLQCNKLVVLQKEDDTTLKAISVTQGINILIQKENGYGNALKEGINSVKTKARFKDPIDIELDKWIRQNNLKIKDYKINGIDYLKVSLKIENEDQLISLIKELCNENN